MNLSRVLLSCPEISTPTSLMARIARGRSRVASVPALDASNRSLVRCRSHPSAIWLRAELWVQMNSTRCLVVSAPGSSKLIPYPIHRLDKLRVCGVGFQLEAEPADVNVHGAGAAHEVVTPYAVEQGFPGEDLHGVRCQEGQQLDLFGLHFSRLARQRDGAPRTVYHQVTRDQRGLDFHYAGPACALTRRSHGGELRL